jgi:EAL domain-containing protein (putative c-di-GMP-specific phosphodiesterase class I)
VTEFARVSCKPQQALPAIAGRPGSVACGPQTDQHNSIAPRPTAHRPEPPLDVAQALCAGWLELWYQPKIDSRSLAMHGVEALIRMRHPQWGVLQPSNFLPAADDPYFRPVSQFVVDRALDDWRYFVSERRHIDLSINLPISFLDDAACIDHLRRQLPDHPAFDGLIVEIDGGDIARELSMARKFANHARIQKIAISVDRLGNDWTAFRQLRDFPFVEIKVDRELVSGCADDRSKRRLCRHIVEVGSQFGARTVAVGVETEADFLTARELGFDLIQGFLFARPMGASSLVRADPRDVIKAM